MTNAGSSLLILFFSFFATGYPSDVPEECRSWFRKGKIAINNGCDLKCAMLDADMNSFDCSRFCDQLCGIKKDESAELGFKLASLYPGLTNAEKEFAGKRPKDALRAYWLSWQAEGICKKRYFVSDTNDESDACRHYIWAALLSKEFGTKLASEILDSHEQNADQPEEERSMDLANNRRGLIVFSDLIKDKELSDSELMTRFLADLKAGKIVVLKGKRK